MSQQQAIHTDAAPAAIGPYSQAILINGFLFCSGQVALKPGQTAAEFEKPDVVAQTHQVMANIRGLLGSVGLDFTHVVKTTIFLSSMEHFKTVNEIYGAAFEGGTFPARSTVAAAGLPLGVDVEIEVVAYVPPGHSTGSQMV